MAAGEQPVSGRGRDSRASAGPTGHLRRTRGCLRVVITDERGRRLRRSGLAGWLQRVAPRHARGTVSVALVSDQRVQALNRMYRRRDYATDVLSFSSVSPNPKSLIPNPGFLGDIVIARGVARRQARRAGHSELTELRVLALHGLLHLLGYDHERDRGEMRRVEQRLRRKGRLREGLIERYPIPVTPGGSKRSKGVRRAGGRQGRPVLDTPERDGAKGVRRGGGAPRR